ncbi:MAG: PAS domain-containing protein [Phycisphaeraceae bacterium]|nr:PAS domain-containing protein [Phycisphaeraceae bacterium]
MPLRPPMLRTMATAAAGVWAVVGAGIALELIPSIGGSAWGRVAVLATTGLAATGVIIAVLARRSARIADVERVARAIAAADIARPGDRPSVGVAHERGEDAGEFAPVYDALDELAVRVERQLKEVAKKSRNLEAVIDAMDEPLLATDNAERVLLCNRSAEALLGATGGGVGGGLVGRAVSEVFTQADLLELHAAARQGQTRRRRVRVTTTLGKRTLQVSALPVPAAWGQGVFGAVMILRDVTEIDQAVQVKADFVANASHELRTPVSAIRMSAETLKDAVKEDPAMAERLAGIVLSHALRLEDLLRDLLDLSRLESPDVQLSVGEVDLVALAEELRSAFADDLAARRLELSFEFEDELTGMRTDARLLMLILRNLVENACKFAHEGTTVRIIGTLEEEESGLEAGASRTRGVARFEIIDRGVGIPLAQQERVFERFYQVDTARTGSPAKRGTGLGLAIVKHAARALKGRVGLESKWGEGTRVWAEVPVEFAPDPIPSGE